MYDDKFPRMNFFFSIFFLSSQSFLIFFFLSFLSVRLSITSSIHTTFLYKKIKKKIKKKMMKNLRIFILFFLCLPACLLAKQQIFHTFSSIITAVKICFLIVNEQFYAVASFFPTTFIFYRKIIIDCP